MIDEGERFRTRAPRRTGATLALALLAFVGGVLLSAAVFHRSTRVARLLHPELVSPAQVVAMPAAAAAASALVRPEATAQAPVAVAADPALAEKVEAIDDRVEAIDARAEQASGEAGRAEALLVAFAARRAIDAGQPLGYLEGLLRARFGAGQPQAVAMVIGAARQPVTLLRLQDDYAALSPSLTAPATSANWWTGVRRELGELLVVRRAQTASADPVAVQARVVRALGQGDVQAALDEVARMPGAPTRGQAWIAAARRYVLAHNALDRIEAAALLPPAPPAV